VKPTTHLYLKDKEILRRHNVSVQTFETRLSANNLPTGFIPPQKSKVMKWALVLARWFYKGPRPRCGLKCQYFIYKPVLNSFDFSVNYSINKSSISHHFYSSKKAGVVLKIDVRS